MIKVYARKVGEIIQWSVKHQKSQGMKSINHESWRIVAWSDAAESKTSILFILCYGEFKAMLIQR